MADNEGVERWKEQGVQTLIAEGASDESIRHACWTIPRNRGKEKRLAKLLSQMTSGDSSADRRVIGGVNCLCSRKYRDGRQYQGYMAGATS